MFDLNKHRAKQVAYLDSEKELEIELSKIYSNIRTMAELNGIKCSGYFKFETVANALRSTPANVKLMYYVTVPDRLVNKLGRSITMYSLINLDEAFTSVHTRETVVKRAAEELKMQCKRLLPQVASPEELARRKEEREKKMYHKLKEKFG